MADDDEMDLIESGAGADTFYVNSNDVIPNLAVVSSAAVLRRTMFEISKFRIVLALCCLFVWNASALSDSVSPNPLGPSPISTDGYALLQLETLIKEGRPPQFYELSISNKPDVCRLLSESLAAPYRVDPTRSTDAGRDLLLGNRYSAAWTDLKSFMPFPASRTTVDLNNDGIVDVLYREASTTGGPYVYSLFLTDSHPANETMITRERQREVAGPQLQETKWADIETNRVIVIGPKYVAKAAGYIDSIHPPLPDHLNLPLAQIADVVQINARSYLLVASAYYATGKPLAIFVFETRTPRDHSLICHFEAKFGLTRP
jgi:hypothetical protein